MTEEIVSLRIFRCKSPEKIGITILPHEMELYAAVKKEVKDISKLLKGYGDNVWELCKEKEFKLNTEYRGIDVHEICEDIEKRGVSFWRAGIKITRNKELGET